MSLEDIHILSQNSTHWKRCFSRILLLLKSKTQYISNYSVGEEKVEYSQLLGSMRISRGENLNSSTIFILFADFFEYITVSKDASNHSINDVQSIFPQCTRSRFFGDYCYYFSSVESTSHFLFTITL